MWSGKGWDDSLEVRKEVIRLLKLLLKDGRVPNLQHGVSHRHRHRAITLNQVRLTVLRNINTLIITIFVINNTRCERISWVVVIFVAIGVTPILLITMVIIVVIDVVIDVIIIIIIIVIGVIGVVVVIFVVSDIVIVVVIQRDRVCR